MTTMKMTEHDLVKQGETAWYECSLCGYRTYAAELRFLKRYAQFCGFDAQEIESEEEGTDHV